VEGATCGRAVGGRRPGGKCIRQREEMREKKIEKEKKKGKKRMVLSIFHHFYLLGEVVSLNVFLTKEAEAMQSCSIIEVLIGAVLAGAAAPPNTPLLCIY
jgi:hypothetical protein